MDATTPNAHSRRIARVLRRTTRLLVIAAATPWACTYGPDHRRVRIEDVERRPETTTFAAMVWSELRRERTDFLPIPDRVPSIHGQSVTLYVADGDAQTVRRIGEIPHPPEIRNVREATLLGWKGPAFYVRWYGCVTRPGAECRERDRRLIDFRVDEDGAVTRVGTAPSPLEREPGMGVRAPGERVYMRVYATSDSVRVRTEDGGPFRARFALDRGGELVVVHGASP